MWALLAIDGDSTDVRIIIVGDTPSAIKTHLDHLFSSKYWWDVDRGTEADTIPRLTWRFRNPEDETQEAMFVGQLFGKPVTTLQIKRVEIGKI